MDASDPRAIARRRPFDRTTLALLEAAYRQVELDFAPIRRPAPIRSPVCRGRTAKRPAPAPTARQSSTPAPSASGGGGDGSDSSDGDGEGGDEPSLPPPFERNLTFRQIRQFGIIPKSDRTLKRIFENEPGVIVLPSFGEKGCNHQFLVPTHVIQRVLRTYERCI